MKNIITTTSKIQIKDPIYSDPFKFINIAARIFFWFAILSVIIGVLILAVSIEVGNFKNTIIAILYIFSSGFLFLFFSALLEGVLAILETQRRTLRVIDNKNSKEEDD